MVTRCLLREAAPAPSSLVRSFKERHVSSQSDRDHLMIRLGEVGLDQGAARAGQVKDHLAVVRMLVLMSIADLVLPGARQGLELREGRLGGDRRLVLVVIIAPDRCR